MDLTQSERRSPVASLRARLLAQCSSLFTSTMWTLDSIIASVNLQTTQRLVTRFLLTKTGKASMRTCTNFQFGRIDGRCPLTYTSARSFNLEQEIRSSITKCAALISKAFNALRTWGQNRVKTQILTAMRRCSK